jgi:hypothetical protein
MELKTKLKRLFNKALPEHKERGLEWYLMANIAARDLAHKFDRPLQQVVGVIAALSPNNAWERNLVDAELFLANPSLETKVCTFKQNRRKALYILMLDDVHLISDILNGRKTQSFYHNILYPYTSQAVTVDLWMYRIAGLKSGIKSYRLIEQAVLDASAELKVLPHQLQAVAWTVVRGY